MSLVTCCPDCATTFRVSPAQLSARGGRVRCGKCATIFDGVASLLTEEAIAALPEEPSPQMGLFDARGAAIAPHELAAVSPAQIESPSEHSVDLQPVAPVPPYETTSYEATAYETTTSETTPAPVSLQPETPTESEPVQAPVQPTPAFLEVAPPRTTYSLVWALLAFLGLTLLAGQALVHFRSEISVLLPPARAHLEAACDMLGCEVRLPRRADLMSIESSDLQADTQRKGVIILNALLRNRAPFAQEYPDLELTLTDQSDRALIRRVLKPGEYLQHRRVATAQGVAGGAEEAVRVYLETGSILATGYQLFLFYPCPPPSTFLFWQLSYPSRCQNSRN